MPDTSRETSSNSWESIRATAIQSLRNRWRTIDYAEVESAVGWAIAIANVFLERGIPIQRLQAFVWKVAHNTLKGVYRDIVKRRKWETPLTEVLEQSNSEALERTMFAKALAHAIRSLPEKYREPLVAQVELGYSYAEIAQALGMPQGAARTQVYRAKEMVREQLADKLKA